MALFMNLDRRQATLTDRDILSGLRAGSTEIDKFTKICLDSRFGYQNTQKRCVLDDRGHCTHYHKTGEKRKVKRVLYSLNEEWRLFTEIKIKYLILIRVAKAGSPKMQEVSDQ